jgi:hypothetical protein
LRQTCCYIRCITLILADLCLKLLLQGFVEVWREAGTLLSCEPESPPSQPPWVQSLIEAMSVSGAMLLAAVALLVWMRMAVALRPRWRREKELAEHRKKGVPCGGPATIVVTDIEAYSGGGDCCCCGGCVQSSC